MTVRSSGGEKTAPPALPSPPGRGRAACPAGGPPALEERAELEELFSLPPEDRTVIHLFYYAGYSTREIAHMTGQRPGTVRSRLTRARQRLKKLLESEEDCKGGKRKGEFK